MSGALFLLPLALMDLGLIFKLIFKSKTDEEKIKIHFILISAFLIVAHIAMIFGMLDPSVITNAKDSMKM